MASAQDLELRRITVGEYHRMIDAGILGDDYRVELLEGVIVVAMSPQKRHHAFAVQQLTSLLVRLVGPSYVVLPKLPLTLGDASEPEPDLAVVGAAEAASLDEHPRTALLVIEVSGDSLRKDRGVKAALYARSGIPEYWTVNLVDRCVEVLREPDPARERYRTLLTFERGHELRSTSLHQVTLAVDALFA